MAEHEVEVDEAERRFEELFQAVEGGCDITISQSGVPLAQLAIRPLESILDFVRREAEPWYAVVISKGENGYSAHVPDLPDCVAVADTEDEVEDLVREAMGWHLDALREQGSTPPEPTTRAVYVQAPRKKAA